MAAERGAARCRGNAERLGQMMINLLVNAIEAAAQGESRCGHRSAACAIEVARKSRRIASCSRCPTLAPARPQDVQQTLFEPFVTEKPDGVGWAVGRPRNRRAAWRPRSPGSAPTA